MKTKNIQIMCIGTILVLLFFILFHDFLKRESKMRLMAFHTESGQCYYFEIFDNGELSFSSGETDEFITANKFYMF